MIFRFTTILDALLITPGSFPDGPRSVYFQCPLLPVQSQTDYKQK